MNFFGIGLPEMAVIAAIALLVFGPKRLPEFGRTLGRTLKGFQSASSEFEKEFRSAIASVDVPANGVSGAGAVAEEVSPLPVEPAQLVESSQPPLQVGDGSAGAGGQPGGSLHSAPSAQSDGQAG